jgi:hypothetical protein
MTDFQARELACAITMQAVRDYFAKGATAKKKRLILHELRSKWMEAITDGLSITVAEQLEKNPKEIRARIRKEEEDQS